MSGDPVFRMTIEEVFFIRGRGTVVTGQVEAGTLTVGDEV
jgi:elongation factor Tu